MVEYRIDISVFLDNETDARNIFEMLKKFADKFQTIKKGKPNEEKSVLRLHKCGHDVIPPKPSEILDQ